MATPAKRTILTPLQPGSRTPEEFRAAVKAVKEAYAAEREAAAKKSAEAKKSRPDV